MRAFALAVTCLAVAFTGAVAAQAQSPNIIIKVKGGKGTISNNKEPGGCVTSKCKLILGPGEKLTLKAKPDHGYIFKRWDGPCTSTHGFKCTIKGSNKTERFVVHFGKP